MVATEEVLDPATEAVQRAALIRVIRAKPEATLADLGALIEGRLGRVLGRITIGELIGDLDVAASDVSSTSQPSSASASTVDAYDDSHDADDFDDVASHRPIANRGPTRRIVVSQSSADDDPPTVESRTAVGRAKYDESLYSVLREHAPRALSAGELRKLAGGSDLQARSALQRLVESGRIERTGRARGTRYAVAS